VKPVNREELAKQRELEVINARLAQHNKTVRLTLLLVVALNVVILALLAYLLLGHA
jgi:hypothetical protein